MHVREEGKPAGSVRRRVLLRYLESRAEWLGMEAPELARGGSNPGAVTYQLCDLWQITQTLFPWISWFLKWEDDNNANLTGPLYRLDELINIKYLEQSWACCEPQSNSNNYYYDLP